MRQNKKTFKKVSAIALASTLLISGLPNPQLTQAATTFSMPNQVTIGKGETFQLNIKGTSSKVSFRSSNKKVVSVTKSGKIKGNKLGKATITARLNKKTKKCKVTVKSAPKKISFAQDELTLFPGETKKLALSFSSGYSKKITYKAENSAVASVSANGFVTAKAAGETTITAKSFNEKTATIRCVVASASIPTATDQATTTNQAIATQTPATSPAITGTPLQTASAATNTPAVSHTPDSSLTATNAENTATPTVVPSASPKETLIPTYTPDFDPPALPENSKCPATEQPTSVPTAVPTATTTTTPIGTATTTPVATATITPSAVVSATAIPTTDPTATEQPTVVISAVIKKIEDGTIYIDNGRTKLQLTSCITYYKDSLTGKRYQITKEELLPGDSIEITSSGLISNTYPVSTLADCEQIIVTDSSANNVVETPVYKIEDYYLYSEHKEFIFTSNTKIYKNGQRINMDEIKKGDIVRINALGPTDQVVIPDCLEFTPGFIETLIVLGDSVENLETTQAFFFYRDTVPSFEAEIWYTDAGHFYVSNNTLLEITHLDGSITYKSALAQTPPMTNLTIYYKTLYPNENPDTPIQRAVRICYSEEYEDPFSTIAPKKPVIYLYPEEKTDVTVDLDFDGELTYTYPYTEDGHWEVTADTDGTLTNKADGLEYSYLFWEGVTDQFTADFSKGFCVKGKDTTKFLQDILPKMGLTPKEYNEFIVYWAPLMQENAYNLISFQTENYEQNAPLHINPAPDSMLRIYMAYKPLTSPVNIEPQTFEPFERNGFTVVEWGGCMVSD